MNLSFTLTAFILLISFSTVASTSEINITKTDMEINSEDIMRGRQLYKKSNCAFCHGWAGDGRGHPRSPGAAASLRDSSLERDSMETIIRCGVTGGVMPYHDRMAYRDNRCIVDPGKVTPDQLPQKGKSIREPDFSTLVTYITFSIIGVGTVTFEQCEAYFKSGSRNCLYLKP